MQTTSPAKLEGVDVWMGVVAVAIPSGYRKEQPGEFFLLLLHQGLLLYLKKPLKHDLAGLGVARGGG